MNKAILLSVFILSSLLFSSCGKKGNLSKTVNEANLNQVDFNYFSSKVKINYQDDKQSFDLNAILRMKKDETVWINLVGPFGIKVGKALITKDSIQVLRDFQASEYYAYSLKELNSKYNTNVSLYQAQNFFLGNLLSQSKPKIANQNNQLSLEQKEGLFTILSTVLNTKIETVNVKHSQTEGDINIVYSEFEDVDSKKIPSKINLKIVNPQLKMNTELQLKNSTFTNEELSFPFSVSDKYERK